MDKDKVYELLRKLCSTHSPSGFEDEVKGLVIDELKPYADSLWVDSLGNVIALKKGSGDGKLMIAAHLDEIGLMISHIDKRGFLRFTPVGGWSERILPAQRVIILTRKGTKVRGVIGIKPPHLMTPEEAKQVIPMKDLFIDIGVSSRGEAEKLGVKVGCIAVLDREVVRLGNGDVVTGKSFDDRVGVAVMIEAFKQLDNVEANVYAVATVQEEVGLKGARVAAFSIGPDIALALDVTTANDVPTVQEHEWIAQLGKGPTIKVIDGRSGTGLISHPAVRELLIKTAEEEGIPYQVEVAPAGTTDASAIQLTREGVPAGVVSVPTRYIHSPTEVLNLNDVINAVKLVRGFAKRVTDEWINIVLKKKIK